MDSDGGTSQADVRRLRAFVDTFTDHEVSAAFAQIPDTIAEFPELIRRAVEIGIEIGVEWRNADPIEARDLLLQVLASPEMEALLEAITLARLTQKLRGRLYRVSALCATALLGSPVDRLAMRDHLAALLELRREDFVVLASLWGDAADDPAWRQRHAALLEGPARAQRMAKLVGLGLAQDDHVLLLGWLLVRAMAKAVA